jgi:hypothetical protein
VTSVNFSDMLRAAGEAGAAFEALPAGQYDVVVDTAVSKPTSTGKDSISVSYKVTTGPYAGRNCFTQFVLSPDKPTALSFFFRHMAAMSLGENYFQSNPPLERVAADLIGRQCRVTLSVRQFQGQDRNQVDQVLPPVGNAQAPVTSPAPSTSPAPQVTGSGAVKPPAVPNVPAVPATVPNTPAITPPPPPPADDDLPF